MVPLRSGLIAIAIGALALGDPARADEAGAEMQLENAQVTLTFAPSPGALISCRDRKSGRELLAQVDKPRLFSLEFAPTSDWNAPHLTLSNADARQVRIRQQRGEGGRAVLISYSDLAGKGIDVLCRATVADGDPLVRWSLDTNLPGGLTLTSVRFPIVTLRPMTGDVAEDAFVCGATKGGITRGLSVCQPGRSVQATQPGSLAAAFGCYYGPEGGWYTAALDPKGHRKTIAASRVPAGVEVAWTTSCSATGSFPAPFEIATALFGSDDPQQPTDWRHAADLYRSWAETQAWCARTLSEREDLPDWLRQGPAMVRFHRDWLQKPEQVRRWITDYWAARFPAAPLVVAYWGWEKVDTWITPDYFPVFPSDREFRSLAAFVRQNGGHTFLWPSGYHYTTTYRKWPDGSFEWDDRSRFERDFQAHAVHGRDGTVLLRDCSWLHGGQNATLCPGDPFTIDWLNRIATQLVDRGADIIQVDQVVGGNFPDCYDAQHPHPTGPGPWETDAFHQQLRSMREACRKVDPQSVVAFEEPNEHFIQEAGLQDYRDWEVMKRADIEPASVFNYLYHDYLPTFQSNPTTDPWLTAWCLVNGQIPHLIPRVPIGPGPLLLDGDFESPLGSVTSGWTRVPGYRDQVYSGEVTIDDQNRHSGRHGLRLRNSEPGEMAQGAQNLSVGKEIHVGREYRLSLWIRSGGMAKNNALSLGAFTDGLKPTGSWRIEVPSEPGEWEQRHVDFAVPPGSRILRLMLNLVGPGTVWFDDVRFEELHEDGTSTTVERSDLPADHRLMHQWVTLFHGAGRPYLLLGRMLHPPRLETGTQTVSGRTFPVILHNAFRAPDGTEGVVVVNPTDSVQTGRLHWAGSVREIELQPEEVQLVR